jgi:hypothetical protein
MSAKKGRKGLRFGKRHRLACIVIALFVVGAAALIWRTGIGIYACMYVDEWYRDNFPPPPPWLPSHPQATILLHKGAKVSNKTYGEYVRVLWKGDVENAMNWYRQRLGGPSFDMNPPVLKKGVSLAETDIQNCPLGKWALAPQNGERWAMNGSDSEFISIVVWGHKSDDRAILEFFHYYTSPGYW